MRNFIDNDHVKASQAVQIRGRILSRYWHILVSGEMRRWTELQKRLKQLMALFWHLASFAKHKWTVSGNAAKVAEVIQCDTKLKKKRTERIKKIKG